MSRAEFTTWGLELNEDEFAAALAALGTIQARFSHYPYRAEDIPGLLETAIKEAGEVVPWTLWVRPGELASYAAPTPARPLAEAWRSSVYLKRWLRIEVRTDPAVEPVLPWVIHQFARPAVNLASVYVLDEEVDAPVRWSWPLQVSLLGDPASSRLYAQLKGSWAGEKLARVAELADSGEDSDLLLLPWSLRESVAAILAQPSPVRASCVIVLGGMNLPWNEARSLTAVLRNETRASGIGIQYISPERREDWFNRLIETLSHNQPLDVCLHIQGPPFSQGWSPFLLLTTRKLLEDSQLKNVADRLSGRLTHYSFSRPVDLTERSAEMLELPPGEYPARDLGERLENTVDKYRFQREVDEASGLAELAKSVDEAIERAAPAVRPPRFMQAQAFEVPQGVEPQRLRRALRAGAPHRLVVRIGPLDEDWIGPQDLTAFPAEKLPPSIKGHRLKVVFSEPVHVPQPQAGAVFLPADGGPSTPVEFYFHTQAGDPSFEARLMILHRNRVLQSALLRAQVLPEPEQAAPGEAIELVIEGVIRPDGAGLEGRRLFDAALLVNHSRDGNGRMTAVSENQAEVISLRDVLPIVDEIGSKLREIAENPARFPKKLDTPATVELLRFLAIQGSGLYETIVMDQVTNGALASAKRIQLVSATPEAFLPVEFMYEFSPPDLNAGLCPKSREALKAGACSGCAGLDERPSPVICPLGFWGLSRVIERQAYDKSRKEELGLSPSEFALLAEPTERNKTLSVLTSAVYAASSRVDAKQRGAAKKVLERLNRITGQKAIQVDSWAQWVSEVQARKPSLLVLLPHTLEHETLHIPTLEIGQGEQLLARYISDKHIRAPDSPSPPIVLLIGCETLTPANEFQGFVGSFRRYGAAIVVSTITTVLGRHAAPVAGDVVEILGRSLKAGDYTFGDVMLALRRQALAAGIPMVLGLFAYGDADWKLAGGM